MPRVRAWIPCEQYPSTPFCLLFDAILHANNIRDAADDRTARVRTLATALSPKAAQQLQLFRLFGPLAFVSHRRADRFPTGLEPGDVAGFAAPATLLRAAKTLSVEGTAQTHLVFGLLYATSFLPSPLLLWS